MSKIEHIHNTHIHTYTEKGRGGERKGGGGERRRDGETEHASEYVHKSKH